MHKNISFVFKLDNNTNENKSNNRVERDENDQSKSWWRKKRKNFDKFRIN